MFYNNVYINLVYCTYFSLLKAIFDFNNSLVFILASILGLLLKLLFVRFYSKKKSLNITILKDKLEVVVFFVLLLIIIKNHNFNVHEFGLFNIMVYYILFITGYFIGVEKPLTK